MIELNSGEHQSKSRGQAMVEYALIMALLAVSFGFAIAATGPAIGNVFCNVVHNIGGNTASPQGQCGNAAPDLVAEGGDPAKFWATVTWVAGHPQGETPFPTPIRRAPTSVSGGLQTSTYTPTPSDTPTPTDTSTATDTNTSTLVPTAGPSPTVSDFAFSIPFVDQINNKDWWRLDLADVWKEQWYNASTFTTASTTNPYTFTFSSPAKALTIPGSNSLFFDLTTSAPNSQFPDTGVAGTDYFGATFTRAFQVTQATSYTFSIKANDAANVSLDGTVILWNNNITNTKTVVVPVTSGMHTVYIEYAEQTNNSNITFSMTPGATTAGTPDPAEQDNSCSWGQTSGTNNPVSVSFMFEANPGQSTWPAGQTCYLEMRGSVDLNGHANPMLSFWDIWDFMGASGLTAQLQIGKYSVVNGSADRTAFNWQTIATHIVGTKNYAWTRNEIDLSPYIGSLGNNVTFRYVIGGTGGTTFRWFLDDLQVLDASTTTTPYTINKSWNLDATDQMDDFIFDGDSFRSIQKYGLPTSADPWRWQLTSNNAHSNMAWDSSPGYNDQNITGLTPNPTGTTISGTDVEPRIHFLQFKNLINLTGTLPADNDGDTGNPLLTFWQAYEVKPKTSIRVEYYDTGTSTWTAIPNQGTLIDYTVPTGSSRTNLTMQPVKIDLTNVPNWSTANFKLRFAMYVDGSATTFGQGWYIDDIKIEREKSSPYMAYPFVDNAENPIYTGKTWEAIGGKWGKTTEKAGALNSATAYSDSPLTTYDPSDTQEFQTQYAIDLLRDSPLNTTDAPGRLAAVNPVLTFWHQRNITSGATFSVELWTASTNTWTQVWLYDASADPFPTEKAWQRVEIDLQTAVALADSLSWTTIVGNASKTDDDIKIRFRFDTGSSTAADGVYVDEIHVENASTTTQNLWTGVVSGVMGNGPYVDSIDTASPLPISPDTWSNRWYAGGQWNTTTLSDYYKFGSVGLSDSPTNYLDSTFSVLEMVPIVNMTNTPAGSSPKLTFWTRFNVGAGASFRVDIATATAGTANDYDQIGGWSAWVTQPMMVGVPAPSNLLGGTAATAVDTWLRGQVDLSSFITKQIRVRFVANVPSGATLADGQYLDEIAFTYSPSPISVPMVDNAQSTSNWVTEGSWGLAKNYFLGSGSSGFDFGTYPWVGTYYDCELTKPVSGYACNDTTGSVATTMNYVLTHNTDYLISDSDHSADPSGKIGPEINLSQITDINFNWVDGVNRPLSNASPVGLSNRTSDSPLQPGFDDTFAARWTRTVDLKVGTYNFSTISDDGVRVFLTNNANITGLTSIGGRADYPSGGYIINNWANHGPTLDYGTFTVTTAGPRTLVVEYFENWGGAQIVLNATSSTFSFTDSPNSLNPSPPPTYSVTTSTLPGNSSLMLNGYFDLSGATNPVLLYQRLYDLAANNTFTAEVSTNGGFTWTVLPQSIPPLPAAPPPVGSLESLTGPASRLPPGNYWEQRSIKLDSYKVANVMIRFRLDTRSASATGDGVYLADIRVTP